jgi:hypothetical protein
MFERAVGLMTWGVRAACCWAIVDAAAGFGAGCAKREAQNERTRDKTTCIAFIGSFELRIAANEIEIKDSTKEQRGKE